MKLTNILEATYSGHVPHMDIGDKNNAVAVIPYYFSRKEVEGIVEFINETSIDDAIKDGEPPLTVEEVLTNPDMFKIVLHEWLADAIQAGSDHHEFWNADGWFVGDIMDARK